MKNELNNRIEKIEARNKRVELDKKWETSFYRKFSITIITYIIATAVMFVIRVERPFLGALIPTLGYVLSTLSLPILRKMWERKQK